MTTSKRVAAIESRLSVCRNERRILSKEELDEVLDRLTPEDVAAMPEPLRGVVDATLTYRRIVNP